MTVVDVYYGGAIVFSFGSAITAFGVLRQRFIDHEKQDNERFVLLREDQKEIKSDVKELLRRQS